MALGVTDHIWSIAELLAAAPEPSDVPPLPRSPIETTLRPGYVPFKPRVIRGGKMDQTTVRHLQRESNPRRTVYKTAALPLSLWRRIDLILD
jgi:hypothetical protein